MWRNDGGDSIKSELRADEDEEEDDDDELVEEFRRNNDEADAVVVVVTGCLDGVDVDATCLLLLVSMATFISGSSLMLPPLTAPFDVDADNNCISCMRICFLNEDGCV